VPTAAQLERHGAQVIELTQRQTILGDRFLWSGEIPRVTPFEVGMLGHYRLADDGANWEPGPLIDDERYVAVLVKDKELVIFTACSHAGVVKLPKDARKRHPATAIHAIFGGFHLSGTNERVIPDTVEAMRHFGLATITPDHCTGWRSVGALSQAFGSAVVPAAVGKTYRF
jgi:7,8-dihydropterin-6-yl-methyl-4-(beta-D-ribofuranosyl)aminobenzene 5'-phosphate synthase